MSRAEITRTLVFSPRSVNVTCSWRPDALLVIYMLDGVCVPRRSCAFLKSLDEEWWRRWESNPRPEAFGGRIYMLIQFPDPIPMAWKLEKPPAGSSLIEVSVPRRGRG